MKIETYVFLDVEATGFPEQERNQTKLTQLACQAVARGDLESATSDCSPTPKKFSSYFNPQRQLTADAFRVTGFTKDFLSDKPLFREKVESLNNFLDLPKPVCLVSHGGRLLDFKLLKTEYKEAKVEPPAGLMHVDTFLYFKAKMPRYSSYNGSVIKEYKLRTLYNIVVKKEAASSHDAGEDCRMLAECVIATKRLFMPWADVNSKSFELTVQTLR